MVCDIPLENEFFTLSGKRVSETFNFTQVKKNAIPKWLLYPGQGNIWNMFPLFGYKCPSLVDKVNYDRPFMDHFGWKRGNLFCWEMARKVNYDQPLVDYDLPQLACVGRKSKVNYEQPLVNYDRLLSTVVRVSWKEN